MERRQLAVVLAGFAAGAVGLWIYTISTGTAALRAILAAVDVPLLALAVVAAIGSYLCRAQALSLLLSADRDGPGFVQTLTPFFAATFAKLIAPIGTIAGAPYLAYVLERIRSVRFERALAGVVGADLMALVPIFTFSVVGFIDRATDPNVPPVAEGILLGVVASILIVGGLTIIFFFKREAAELALVAVVRPIRGFVGRRRPRWNERLSDEGIGIRVDGFYQAFDTMLDEPAHLIATLAVSFLSWFLMIVPMALIAQAIGSPVSLSVLFFVVPVSILANIVPTPGGLGAVEITLTELLVTYGAMTRPVALAGVLLWRLATYWIPLLIGAGTTAVMAARWPHPGQSR